jgi:hypothetical protein
MDESVPFRSVPPKTGGWCWQDNELYIALPPIIGAQSCWVYASLTRLAHGADVQDTSLRDLGKAAGLNKDAVSRAILVLKSVGMIVVKRNGRKVPATYQLKNLKKLVISLGGKLDNKSASYVLPEAEVLRLQNVVERLCKASQRKAGAHSDNLKNAESDSGVAPGGRECRAMERHPFNSKTQDYETKNINPIAPMPADAAGDGIRLVTKSERLPIMTKAGISRTQATESTPDEIQRAVTAVRVGCGWSRIRRLEQAIAEQLTIEFGRGVPVAEAAQTMVKMRDEYERALADGLLRYPCKPRSFIAEGKWRDSKGWPFDRERIAHLNRARQGMNL